MFTHAEWKARAAALQFRNQCWIDGAFVPSLSGARFETVNPATGAVITDVARGGAVQIGAWIDGAMPMRAEIVSGYVQALHTGFVAQRLADATLDCTLRWAWPRLRQHHRPDPQFAVIAYGKLGGKELGYASDLDIVFVYDDPAPDSAELYTRLSQRTNTWLSAQTPAGSLFETDLRLRPNGDSGLMVVSLESFRQYQLENAWVWEHQALTRARFCAGDKAIGAKFEAIRIEVLRQRRDLAKLRIDRANARMNASRDDSSQQKPDDPVTRSQMAAFLIRARLAVAAGTAFPFPNTFSFIDAPPSYPTYDSIQKMKELGVTSGCSATGYCGNDPNTRGQMAVFLARGMFSLWEGRSE